MKNYLSKYFIKALLVVFGIAILIIAIASFAINISLSKSKGAIEREFSKYLGRRISLESANYFPPNFLILNDVSISAEIAPEEKQLIFVEKIRLRFSPIELIRKRNFPTPTKQNLNCVVKGVFLNFPGRDNFIASATLKIKDGRLVSQGTLNLQGFPLDYSLKGTLAAQGLNIETLKFGREKFQAKFWGGLDKGLLRLYGFSTSLYIYDIDCLVKFAFPKVLIENLNFSFNNIPFSLRGDIHLSGLTPSNLELSSQKIKAALKNLSFYFSEEKYLELKLDEASLSYARGGSLSHLLFKDFKASFDLRDERFKFAKLGSTICDGSLDGEGYIDISQFPVRQAFNFEIKDVNASRLNPFNYPVKTYGKLEAIIFCRSYPRLNLNGKIILRKGCLDNLKFFRWLAEFFDIPSLKRVDFDRLCVNFFTNAKIVNLENIDLDSKDVSLDGYFNLQENNLVSSKISLGLSRRLLETSLKFRPLLKLLKKDFSSLNFDFQLSGVSQAMNIKWLESDFKKKLKSVLSDPMKRGIERKVEEIIGSISAEE